MVWAGGRTRSLRSFRILFSPLWGLCGHGRRRRFFVILEERQEAPTRKGKGEGVKPISAFERLAKTQDIRLLTVKIARIPALQMPWKRAGRVAVGFRLCCRAD